MRTLRKKKINFIGAPIVLAIAIASLIGITSPQSSVKLVFADDNDNSSLSQEEDKQNTPAVWLQVSPVSNRVVLNRDPNDNELTYIYNVDNIGSEDFKFKVYATPYYVKNDSYDVDFSTETNRTEIARWISFRANGSKDEFKPEATFSVKAGERFSVEYKITVPESVPSGGQYASIVTEYIPSDTISTTGVQTIPRVNMIVYGSTHGDTIEEGTINDHALAGFLTSGKVTADSLVSNSGNTDFAARYQFKVESIFGQKIYDQDVTYDILPETSRRISMAWEETPPFGVFHVTSSVSALDETSTHSKIVLIVPLFILIILVILLTSMIAWAIILIKKRQARRSRVIV